MKQEINNQPSTSSDPPSLNMNRGRSEEESDRALALAVLAQHDIKKRNALTQKLHMLQKEERALQTLLVRLRGQQSNLTIEKMRLAEEHKRLVEAAGDNIVELDDDDDEEEEEEEEGEMDEDEEENDNSTIFNDKDSELFGTQSQTGTEMRTIKTEALQADDEFQALF